MKGGPLHPIAQKGVGYREEETRTVAGAVICGDRPPMTDAMQRCEGGVDDSSAGSPSSVSDETDPAGVVLEARVVQACVTQDVSLTLSSRPLPRHGRLHQKDEVRSYLRHKWGQAERRYRQPLCARHPYRRPLRRLGRGRRVEYPSLMVMLALAFGSVKRLAYANLTDRATYAKRLAVAN